MPTPHNSPSKKKKKDGEPSSEFADRNGEQSASVDTVFSFGEEETTGWTQQTLIDSPTENESQHRNQRGEEITDSRDQQDASKDASAENRSIPQQTYLFSAPSKSQINDSTATVRRTQENDSKTTDSHTKDATETNQKDENAEPRQQTLGDVTGNEYTGREQSRPGNSQFIASGAADTSEYHSHGNKDLNNTFVSENQTHRRGSTVIDEANKGENPYQDGRHVEVNPQSRAESVIKHNQIAQEASAQDGEGSKAVIWASTEDDDWVQQEEIQHDTTTKHSSNDTRQQRQSSTRNLSQIVLYGLSVTVAYVAALAVLTGVLLYLT